MTATKRGRFVPREALEVSLPRRRVRVSPEDRTPGRIPLRRAAGLGLGLSLLVSSLAFSADWPRFRGPGGRGISSEKGFPLRWSNGENLLWKVELPGPGSSSPILASGRIYVTCYSGYAVDRRDPGDLSQLRRHVVCVDAASGKVLWDRSFRTKGGEEPFRGIGVPQHGYASHTPVSDGERVFAFFGVDGVVAYDKDGKELWRQSVSPDPKTHNFGTAASPILAGDLLIVPAAVECEEIIGYDKKTGREVWRSPAHGYGAWWGTPALAENEGRTDLIVNVPGELWGLNPKTGRLRWYAETFPARTLCTSPATDGRIACVIGDRQGRGAAVRLGGRGNVTESHVLWRKPASSYVPSPLLHEGRLYWVNDRGIAFCLNAETGEEIYRERIEDAGGVYASVVFAENRLYAVTRRNGTFVLAAGPAFKVLARNTFEGDETDFNATPALSGGRIYLRSNRYLYAVGEAKAGS